MNRPLYAIAHDVRRYWTKVNYAAVPYLDAMSAMNAVTDNYYNDPGKYVVRYFLANATGWRGADAKRVKAELKELLKS